MTKVEEYAAVKAENAAVEQFMKHHLSGAKLVAYFRRKVDRQTTDPDYFDTYDTYSNDLFDKLMTDLFADYVRNNRTNIDNYIAKKLADRLDDKAYEAKEEYKKLFNEVI